MRLRVLMFAIALIAFFGAVSSYGQDKAKYKTSEVMEKCMKGGLCKKVADGKASKEEKAELVTYFTALAENKPGKGDAKSWEEKTKALVDAAKLCAADDKDGPAKLKAAANCKACHDVHKGK